MSRESEEQQQAAARAFLHSAQAMQSWDLIELRDAWGLPADTPLDRLADVVARLHHLPSRSAESIERALCESSARPWLERSHRLGELAAQLPAVLAFIEIEAPASKPSTDVVFVR